MDVEAWTDERLGVGSRSSGRHGPQLVTDCPICGKHRLYIQALTGLWCCFYCRDSGGGGQGSFAALLALVEGLPLAAARERIRTGRGYSHRAEAREEPRIEPEQSASELEPLPADFIPVFAPGVGWTFPEYLRERGVRARTAARYGLGSSRGRVVLPIRMDGALVGWQVRSTDPTSTLRYKTSRGVAPEALFGFDLALCASPLVLVEGPFDVLALAQQEHLAVALQGKVLHPEQALAVRDSHPGEVVLLLDGDVPGRKAVAAAGALLVRLGLQVRVARLSPEADPSSHPEISRHAVEQAEPYGHPLRERLRALR